MEKIKIRVAPSLGGGFDRTFEEAWNLETYNPDTDTNKPTVFCGLYGFPDFYSLWRHKGKKYIFWCGSDIRHFSNGYWLDVEGHIRISSPSLATWIEKNCESWVENEAERELLRNLGIRSQVCPSFLGSTEEFPLSYEYSDRPKLYSSVSGDDFILYGWYLINRLALGNPWAEFHLYGNIKDFKAPENVIVHGRVPKEQMNAEIKTMQAPIRLIPVEGFSEIVAKGLLMGQWPVSMIEYPNTIPMNEIAKLKSKKEANIKGREWLLNNINKYPFNCNK